MIDGAVLGGLCLILGNYFTYKGNIFRAIQVFLLADIAWLWLAISTGNIFGIVTVTIGVVLSFIVFWKMFYGHFHKTIHKDRV